MPRRPHRPDRSARSGLTFLETVFATLILGLVAMTSLGAVSWVARMQRREARDIAAAELASRMMIMYLDEMDIPTKEGPLLDWPNGDRYRWQMSDTHPVQYKAAVEPPADSTQRSIMNLDRIREVKVHVWLSEESGGSMSYDTSVPNATITRLVDPFQVFRRHDSMNRIWRDPAKKEQLERMMRGETGRGGSPSGGSPSRSSGGGK